MRLEALGLKLTGVQFHLHCLGTEEQCVFYTLQNTGTKYDEAVSTLEAHFISKVNMVIARHQFRQRALCADEMNAQYTTALVYWSWRSIVLTVQ